MADETIDCFPIIGWEMANHPSGVGLLIIHSLPAFPSRPPTPEEIATNAQSVRYGIHPEQCLELAAVLMQLAEKLQQAKSALN